MEYKICPKLLTFDNSRVLNTSTYLHYSVTVIAPPTGWLQEVMFNSVGHLI